jgi:methylated-DNA-[protein]-cysteine S-methyltransferase
VSNAKAAPHRWNQIESPVGPLLLGSDGERLTLVHFQAGPRPLAWPANRRAELRLFRDVAAQLSEYFAGSRRTFTLPLAFDGTDFQQQVWRELLRIRFGETLSYLELAQRIGRPHASRAVGSANGANPLPIIVPCHRVVGTDGSLTGFGGGLAAKRWLLGHERAGRGTRENDLFGFEPAGAA